MAASPAQAEDGHLSLGDRLPLESSGETDEQDGYRQARLLHESIKTKRRLEGFPSSLLSFIGDSIYGLPVQAEQSAFGYMPEGHANVQPGPPPFEPPQTGRLAS